MKKYFLISVLFLFVLVIGLFTTCPDRTNHTDKVKEVLTVVMNQAVDDYVDGKRWDESPQIHLIKAMGPLFVFSFVETNLMVSDYGVCSIGRITFDGKDYIVSVGFFNRVWTVDSDYINERVAKSLIEKNDYREK